MTELAARALGASALMAFFEAVFTRAVPPLKYTTVGGARATRMSLGVTVPATTRVDLVVMTVPLLRRTTWNVHRPVAINAMLVPEPRHTFGVSGLIRKVFAWLGVIRRSAESAT